MLAALKTTPELGPGLLARTCRDLQSKYASRAIGSDRRPPPTKCF